MNKKIIISGILTALTATSFAFAQNEAQVTAVPLNVQPVSVTSGSTTNKSNNESRENEYREMKKSSSTREIAKEQAKLKKMKAKAKREITNRINSLNRLVTKVSLAKKVSETDRTLVVTSIQSAITSLQTLGVKIEQGTSTAQVKLDTQSITKEYRVYALLVPQINVLTKASEMTTQVNTYASTTNSLKERSAKALAANKDVTEINAKLTDTTTRLASSTMLIMQAISSVSLLKADNGDKAIAENNATSLKNGEALLKQARTEFQTIQKNIVSVRTALRALNF